MKALCVAFLLLVPGLALALAAEQTPYDALVAQLKAGNTMIDYQALRFARSELPGYNPYDALSDPDKGDLIRAMSGTRSWRSPMVAAPSRNTRLAVSRRVAMRRAYRRPQTACSSGV
jgi:hypothetical protein